MKKRILTGAVLSVTLLTGVGVGSTLGKTGPSDVNDRAAQACAKGLKIHWFKADGATEELDAFGECVRRSVGKALQDVIGPYGEVIFCDYDVQCVVTSPADVVEAR
jgi:hypothetical protein